VGAIVYNNAVERTIPPRAGRVQVLRLAHELLRPSVPTGTTTDLTVLVNAAAATVRRRSLIVLISDFISEPGWEKSLQLLSRRHEVIAIRLVDPREAVLPDVGPVILQDAETGEQIYVDTGDRAFRRRFEEAAAAREQAITAGFRRAGIEAVTFSTDEDLVRSIVRMATLRRKRRSA
jgi:uncharacterized protein (DUF58 family)